MSGDPHIDSAELAEIGPGGGVDPVERVQARKRAHAALFGDSFTSANPVCVDRYELIGKAGAGGLGTVWKAYDPKLDRELAIKLLRPDKLGAGQRARRQLMAEAAVMARLTHPNVVRVYDIGEAEVDPGLSGIGEPGSGRVDTQLYVVMEFVDGQTLRQWQLDHEPGVAQLIRVYSEAAAGLVAAHEAALVHGDFKPDNVLIDRRGRVLVTDFAVTRNIVRERVAYELSTLESPTESERNKVRQSIAAVLVGTPAYMAPEQLDGEVPDARSDQFSFCVALWEAVTGERPFAGRTFAALREAIAAGPPPFPAGVRPARLRNVLARGLAEDPRHRYPDLQALLVDLEQVAGPSGRRRARLGALGFISLVGALGALVVVPQLRDVDPPPSEPPVPTIEPKQPEPPEQSCVAEAEQAGAEVWTTARAESLRRRFTEQPGAGEAVETALADWVRRWRSAMVTACVEHRAGTLADDPHRVRHTCLEQSRAHFAVAVDVLVAADARALVYADEVVASLPDFEPCSAPAYAARLTNEPSFADQSQRHAFADARDSLARAEYLELVHEYDDALALVEPILSLSATLGWDAGEARALLLRGTIRLALDQTEAGFADLSESTLAARRAGRPDVEVEALLELALATLDAGEHGRTEHWLELATTAVEASDTPAQRVGLALVHALAAQARGDHPAARSYFAAALEAAQLDIELGDDELDPVRTAELLRRLRDHQALDLAVRRRVTAKVEASASPK